MKLLKLQISGITSLKNAIEIDFAEGLYNEDLFAITGQTGAGKSSILSAISLALYNKGPKKLSPEEYVSLGAHKGQIRLEFCVHGQTYSAHWECRKYSKSGKQIKPKTSHVLFKGDEICEYTPEQVIGLGINQFFKTIIISQGQFHDFLLSPFKDRKLLLEKLYGTDTLIGLTPYLKKKIKEYERELEILLSRREGGLPFSALKFKEKNCELKSLRNSQVELKENKLSFEELLKNFDEMLATLKQIKKDQEIVFELGNKYEVANNSYKDSSKTYGKASEEHEALIKECDKKLPALKNLEKSYIQLQEKIDQHKTSLSEKSVSIEHKDQKIQLLTNKVTQSEIELEKHTSKVKVLPEEVVKNHQEADLLYLREVLSEIKSTQNHINFFSNGIQGLNSKKLHAKQEVKSYTQKINHQLKVHEITAISDLIQKTNRLQSGQEVIRAKLDKHKEWMHACKSNIVLYNNHLERIKQVKADQQVKSKSLDQLLHTRRILEKEINILEKEYNLIQYERALNLCRKKAKEEEQCPVCLSPYQEKIKTEPHLDFEVNHSDQKNKENLEKEHRHLTDQITVLETELKQLSSSLNSEYSASEKLLREISPEKKLEITEISNFKRALDEKKDDLEKQFHSFEKELATINHAYNLVREYQFKTQAASKSLAEIEKEQSQSKEQKQLLIKKLDQMVISTTKFFVKRPDLNIADQIESFLKQKRIFLDLVQKIKILTEKANSLKEQLFELQKEKGDLSKNLKSEKETLNKVKLQFMNLFDRNQFQSPTEAIYELEQSLKQKRAEYDQSKNIYFDLKRNKEVLFNQIDLKKSNISDAKLLMTRFQKDVSKFPYHNYQDNRLLKLGEKTQ